MDNKEQRKNEKITAQAIFEAVERRTEYIKIQETAREENTVMQEETKNCNKKEMDVQSKSRETAKQQMNEEFVMNRINELCGQREWSIYRLAKNSGIPYSTLNNTLKRTNTPTFSTLLKLCQGFGITISQFFADDEYTELTFEQQQLLRLWGTLELEEKYLAEAYLKGLAGGRGDKIRITTKE